MAITANADAGQKDLMRKLKIKSGSVKRLTKEYAYYIKEETQQRAKVEKMREDGKEESDIKQQVDVLNETLTVLPDARNRLATFAKELQQFLDNDCPQDLDLTSDGPLEKEITEAQAILKQSAEHLPA